MEGKRTGLNLPSKTGLQRAFVLLLQHMHCAASDPFGDWSAISRACRVVSFWGGRMVPPSQDSWRLMAWEIQRVKLAHCLNTCKDCNPSCCSSEQHTKGDSAWLAVRTHTHAAVWGSCFLHVTKSWEYLRNCGNP